MAGLLKWLERKAFLGDVIEDFGQVASRQHGRNRVVTSVLLCRRGDDLKLAIRTSAKGLLGAGVQYAYIDVSEESVARLEEIVASVRGRLEDAS